MKTAVSALRLQPLPAVFMLASSLGASTVTLTPVQLQQAQRLPTGCTLPAACGGHIPCFSTLRVLPSRTQVALPKWGPASCVG